MNSCTSAVGCACTGGEPIVGKIKKAQSAETLEVRCGDLVLGGMQLYQMFADARDVAQHHEFVACGERCVVKLSAQPAFYSSGPGNTGAKPRIHT